jgi:stage 0 sporulation protein B (sporulation initiation phosphotransferase)
MNKKWDTIELLRHCRHDWLNQLQLIKGNLALNNVEKVNTIIDDIVQRTANETNLSNLQVDKLASYLLTVNWEAKPFVVDFEVINNSSLHLTKYDEMLTKWFTKFFLVLEDVVCEEKESNIMLSFQLFKEEQSIVCDFSGKINDLSKVKSFLHDELDNDMSIKDIMIHEEELVFTLRLNEVN